MDSFLPFNSDSHTNYLINYCKEWNTSFSKALVAQLVLTAVFTKWKPRNGSGSSSGPIRKTKVSTLYEITIETPLLCSSSLFKKGASEEIQQEIQQEIQCTLVMPDSEYDDSMKEFQSEINKPFNQEQDSSETGQQDLSSFSDFLIAIDQLGQKWRNQKSC